jgi:Spy/CpxP family protein refolding chaperone
MKKLIIIVSLLLLYLFGAVCGFTVAIQIVKRSLSEEGFVEHRKKEEIRRLKLTAAQIEQANPGYEELKEDLKLVKRDTVTAITQAAIKQSTSLATLLTPEQLAEFQKLSEERRARFEKKMNP